MADDISRSKISTLNALTGIQAAKAKGPPGKAVPVLALTLVRSCLGLAADLVTGAILNKSEIFQRKKRYSG